MDACKNITLAHALKAKATFEKNHGSAVVVAVFNIDSDSNVELGDKEVDKYIPTACSSLTTCGGLAASMPLPLVPQPCTKPY